MISSKEVLEKLHNKLLFLEEYAGDTLMRAEIDDCIRHVGYLEEIINELIGEKPNANSVVSEPTKKDIKPADLLDSTPLKNLFGN